MKPTKNIRRNISKLIGVSAASIGMTSTANTANTAIAQGVISQQKVEGADNFYKSDKVTLQKVSFQNQYNLKLAGNLFLPKDLNQMRLRPVALPGR